MDTSVYKSLQNNFAVIRFLHSDIINDDESLNNVKNNIKLIRSVVESEPKNENHKILLYCIDTLFEKINGGNREKIFDFADTIHNMPEMCIGKRDFKSFQYEIKTFRRKYGVIYFADFIAR